MLRGNSLLSTRYRYFLAVAELGSIRAASRELNIASSAVNRQVLLLERSLGQALFERVGRGLVITEAGSALLRHLRLALRGFADAQDELDSLKGLKSGTVRVATVESVSVALLPELLTSFRDLYPGLEVRLTVAAADRVTGLVLDRAADLGFTFSPSSLAGLEVGFEWAFKVGAIVALDHPLAKRKHVDLDLCLKHPVALPVKGLSIRSVLDAVLRRRVDAAKPLLEANSLRVMSTLARQGRVVAFQTEVGVERELAERSLKFLPLRDAELPDDRLMVVRQAGRTLSPAAHALFEYVVDALQKRQRN